MPQVSSGGSVDAAIAAAQPNTRAQSLAALEKDIYARSNAGPTASRVKTWHKIAKAWDLEPLPLTVPLVQAVGASFKAGGYRSAKLYYSTMRKEHQSQLGQVPVQVEIAINDAIRSIERGQGPGRLKDGFSLTELIQVDLSTLSLIEATRVRMVILGCWWLTREIELSAALRRHVTINEDRLTATWTLPISKTQCQGDLIERTHRCLCSTMSPSLCPFHVMKAHLSECEVWWERVDDGPLFFENCSHMSKPFTIECIRSTLQLAGINSTRQDANGMAVQRFHGHCLRVAGAQHMALLRFDTPLIMLLGRWGSQAILRYIQDAPLRALLIEPTTVDVAPAQPSPRTPPRDATNPAVKRLKSTQSALTQQVNDLDTKYTELAAELQTVNKQPLYVVGKKAHAPDHRGSTHAPYLWSARCGWRYGASRFSRSNTAEYLCKKCFPEAATSHTPIAEEGEGSGESSDDSSSSSSSA